MKNYGESDNTKEICRKFDKSNTLKLGQKGQYFVLLFDFLNFSLVKPFSGFSIYKQMRNMTKLLRG